MTTPSATPCASSPSSESSLDRVRKAAALPWFCPQRPFAKQLAFLLLPHLEAFYGGSAGPGKSSGLLMAALQYAELPGYHAILFRKTYADLSLPGALMDRAHEWL